MFFSSCEKQEVEKEPSALSIELTQTEVGCASNSQIFNVVAEGPWTMSISFEDGGDSWASLKKTEGEGNGTNILYWDFNDTEAARKARINLKSGTRTISRMFTQNPRPLYSQELEPDPVPGWLELPATNDEGRFFFTHDMTIGSKKVRNYSFYLDTAALVSPWVAYPLNYGLISSGSRTDAWGNLDPKVPRKYQAVVEKAFKGGFQRGHQIPSADRYEHDANVATFYGTNMTPQRGVLNEDAWAELEGVVRNWAKQLDTLYVVTGADIVGSTEYALDNDGKKVVVPVGYFKALLGYKKGATSTQFPSQKNGFIGIGFYYEHRSYGTRHDHMKQSMSIDELEKKTGFDFFVNLPDEDEAVIESTVSTWWK